MEWKLRISLWAGAGLTIMLLTALSPSVVRGYAVVDGGGHWPSDWPPELEPFRARATSSCSGWANGTPINEAIYEFSFRSQEEFAEAWPALLRIKSKGGTLGLSRCAPTSAGVRDTAPQRSEPRVMILTAPWQVGKVNGAPMDDTPPVPMQQRSLRLPDGTVPKCVGSPWLTDGPDEGWIIVDLDKDLPGNLERYHLERARTDLVLYVDGDIINMNNIQIPKDTPIIDRRFDGN